MSYGPTDFSLQDGGSQTFENLPTGTYVIGENDVLTTGWNLYDVEILDSSGGSQWTNPYQVSIDLDPGETVTVTFKNRPPDFVIPEAPLGTVLILAVMFIAYLVNNKQMTPLPK
jgi:hypothetical protein